MLSMLVSLTIALLSGAVTVQMPRDVTRPALAGTSVLTGRITVIARQPLPVRRARVVLESDAIDAPRTTMADTEGRYRFSELPPGQYRVRREPFGRRRCYLDFIRNKICNLRIKNVLFRIIVQAYFPP